MWEWLTSAGNDAWLPFAGGAIALLYRDIKGFFTSRTAHDRTMALRREDRDDVRQQRLDQDRQDRSMRRLDFEIEQTKGRILEQEELKIEIMKTFDETYQQLVAFKDPATNSRVKESGFLNAAKHLEAEIVQVVNLLSRYAQDDMTQEVTPTVSALSELMSTHPPAPSANQIFSYERALLFARGRFYAAIGPIRPAGLPPEPSIESTSSPILPDQTEQ